MALHLLPCRTGSAAENMAVDFLLLQRYPLPSVARLRHYSWLRPSATFGYSQKWNWVREKVRALGPLELCRRPTGGGVVDHRNDWTYALVLPRGHPLEEARATESYQVVHTCLSEALQSLGMPVRLKQPSPSTPSLGPGLCFEQAEVFDVIHALSGRKIAGAAQKRNKQGLLFQGYLSRGELPESLDWFAFESCFQTKLGLVLGLEAQEIGFPDFGEGVLESLIEHYASSEWLEFR